jgi:hypothetical protein
MHHGNPPDHIINMCQQKFDKQGKHRKNINFSHTFDSELPVYIVQITRNFFCLTSKNLLSVYNTKGLF